MTTQTTHCDGHWKKDRMEYSIRGAQITVVIDRKSKKWDNAVIDFGAAAFDSTVLNEVMQHDPYNCYPYVVLCQPNDISEVQRFAQQIHIPSRIIPFPVDTPWDVIHMCMYACASAKGASKGFNASKSHRLDKIVLNWTRNFLLEFNANLEVFCPRDAGARNEDIRAVLNKKTVYRQEDKSISEGQNIIERLSRIKSKANATGSEDYDLLMTFVGFVCCFLDYIPTHALAHIAKAYVEFSVSEQQDLFNEKNGIHPTLENKHVQLPVDVNDPSKGLIEGPLLKDYILSSVRANIKD